MRRQGEGALVGAIKEGHNASMARQKQEEGEKSRPAVCFLQQFGILSEKAL